MSPEALHALATEIANQTIWGNWLFYLVLICITIISSAAGAALSAYFTKRAEQQALSADFEEIKTQLQETTSISESIKTDINRLAERSEKLQWLKREKLENYVTTISRLPDYLAKEMQHKFFDTEAPADENPLDVANMLQALYLPELDTQHREFVIAIIQFQEWVAVGMQEVLANWQKTKTKQPPSQTHQDQFRTHYDLVQAKRVGIFQAARELARKLNQPNVTQ